MSEFDAMTDEEFDELTSKLFKMGLEDGDLGYQYWVRVIKKLQYMRSQAMKAELNAPPPHSDLA